MAIALFLAGFILSNILERVLPRKPWQSFLPAVLGLEIILIVLAYFALTSLLGARLELFVICLALALGLQNGAWRQAGGITVRSTMITGMITKLLTEEVKKYLFKVDREAEPDYAIILLSGTWVAFIIGVALGAILVLRFGAPGILGVALVLFYLLIRQSVSILRGLRTTMRGMKRRG